MPAGDSLWQKVKSLLSPAARGRGFLDGETVKEIREMVLAGARRIPPGTKLEDLRFVVLDLETTGFAYGGGDEIIAVGAVAVRNGAVCGEERFHRYVYPYRLVPGEVIGLTGIARDMLVGCPGFWGVLPELLRFIGDSVLVGHCIHFDLAFLEEKLKKHTGVKIRNWVLDTAHLVRALYPGLGCYSLDGLLAFYGLEPAGRHTAMGDALLTAHIFVNILKRLKEENIITFGGLVHFLRQHRMLGECRC